MDIKDVLSLLFRKLPIIIFVTTISIILGVFYSVTFVTPKYQSSTDLYLIKADGSEALPSSYLINTYKKIITDTAVAQNIAQILQLDLSPTTIKSYIRTSGMSDNLIITVTVVSPNPQLSADIANTIPEAALAPLQLFNVDKISQMTMAEPAKEPLPYMNKNILLFGFLGLIITVASVLAYEYFDTTVKSTRDIKEKIGLKLLAVIPDTEHNSKGGQK